MAGAEANPQQVTETSPGQGVRSYARLLVLGGALCFSGMAGHAQTASPPENLQAPMTTAQPSLASNEATPAAPDDTNADGLEDALADADARAPLAEPALPQAPVFQARALGALDPWGIGWGGRAEGQLPNTLWRGSDARVLGPLFERVQAQTLSPAGKILARRVVMASGSPPQGDSGSLILARIALLHALGAEDEALELLDMFPALDPSHDGLWTKADRALQEGKMRMACELLPQAEDPVLTNWMKLGAFCRLLEEDTAGADLMVELARAQGVEDPWFFNVVGQTTGAITGRKPAGRLSTGLETAFSLAASLDIPANALDGLSGPALARLARNESLSLALRLEAAERALLAGAADWTMLAQLVALASEPEIAALVETIEPGSEMPPAPAGVQARSFMGSKLATLIFDNESTDDPLARAALFASLLTDPETADRNAVLFADWLTPLRPSAQLVLFASSFTRAAIANGDTTQAARWRAGQEYEGAGLPDPRTLAINNGLIVFLGLDTDPSALAMISKRLIDTARGVNDRQVNARLFALYAALGLKLPPEARQVIVSDLATGGQRVRPGLMVAVRAADDSGSLGEVMMTVLAAMEASPDRLEVSDLAELIAALNEAGLVEEARLLAREAALGYTRR